MNTCIIDGLLNARPNEDFTVYIKKKTETNVRFTFFRNSNIIDWDWKRIILSSRGYRSIMM